MVRTGRLRPPPELRAMVGSTAVILGFGEIGRAIARRLAGLEAHVLGLNRTGQPAPECERMFSANQLREAVTAGDFVFEVRPFTRATARSFGTAELEAMRPNAVFVNVGRAGTVDEEALYRHLQAHPEFRAALDVWWDEDYSRGTLSTRFPFASLPNFTGTPHLAGFGPDSEQRALRLALENLARFFRDGQPRYVADRREYAGEPG
jgi:phosphoglycerate dehydrogenase-like enzyme